MKKWTLEDDSDEEEDKQDNKENKDEIVEEEVDPLDAFMQVIFVLEYYIAVLLSSVMLTLTSGTYTRRLTSSGMWHHATGQKFTIYAEEYLHLK